MSLDLAPALRALSCLGALASIVVVCCVADAIAWLAGQPPISAEDWL